MADKKFKKMKRSELIETMETLEKQLKELQGMPADVDAPLGAKGPAAGAAVPPSAIPNIANGAAFAAPQNVKGFGVYSPHSPAAHQMPPMVAGHGQVPAGQANPALSGGGAPGVAQGPQASYVAGVQASQPGAPQQLSQAEMLRQHADRAAQNAAAQVVAQQNAVKAANAARIAHAQMEQAQAQAAKASADLHAQSIYRAGAFSQANGMPQSTQPSQAPQASQTAQVPQSAQTPFIFNAQQVAGHAAPNMNAPTGANARPNPNVVATGPNAGAPGSNAASNMGTQPNMNAPSNMPDASSDPTYSNITGNYKVVSSSKRGNTDGDGHGTAPGADVSRSDSGFAEAYIGAPIENDAKGNGDAGGSVKDFGSGVSSGDTTDGISGSMSGNASGVASGNTSDTGHASDGPGTYDKKPSASFGLVQSQVDNILREARTKADAIVAEARSRADVIVGQANAQANTIVANATDTAMRTVEHAHDERAQLLAETEESAKVLIMDAFKKVDEIMQRAQIMLNEVDAATVDAADAYGDEDGWDDGFDGDRPTGSHQGHPDGEKDSNSGASHAGASHAGSGKTAAGHANGSRNTSGRTSRASRNASGSVSGKGQNSDSGANAANAVDEPYSDDFYIDDSFDPKAQSPSSDNAQDPSDLPENDIAAKIAARRARQQKEKDGGKGKAIA